MKKIKRIETISPKVKKTESTVVGVHLSNDVLLGIQKIAQKEQRSRSNVIEIALQKYLASQPAT